MRHGIRRIPSNRLRMQDAIGGTRGGVRRTGGIHGRTPTNAAYPAEAGMRTTTVARGTHIRGMGTRKIIWHTPIRHLQSNRSINRYSFYFQHKRKRMHDQLFLMAGKCRRYFSSMKYSIGRIFKKYSQRSISFLCRIQQVVFSTISQEPCNIFHPQFFIDMHAVCLDR